MGPGEKFARLVEVMRRLRGPEGCPWDRKQTHDSIRPYCIEEAYEVVEAIEGGRSDVLRDELGDLLFQVIFHAQLASEEGKFCIGDVVEAIHDKLVRRHPHVFRKDAGRPARTPEEVLQNWSKFKKEEGREHLLDGIPRTLPALQRATRMGEKAATVGFDWVSAAAVREKVEEEMAELARAQADPRKLEEEFGDLLFAMASLARHLRVDAESSLRRAAEKFDRRFRWMETEIRKRGKELGDLDARALDELWGEAKKSAG